MTKINVAILGAGGMGQTHAENLSKIERATVSAVCDIDMRKAELLADKYNCRAYQDFDQLLDKEIIDAVIICLPPFAQQGQFEKACQAGISIFIEKPIALSTERGYKMLMSAKENNIKTQVGYHMRYGSAIQKIKHYIQNGEAGSPVLFNGRYLCRALHAPWWRDVNKSGGQIFEQAIHLYDMCYYLFGKPGQVQAKINNVCHQDVENYTVEDVSASITQMESGSLAVITATNCAVPGFWDAPADITFENIHVSLIDPDRAKIYFTSEEGRKPEIIDEPLNHKFLEMAEFIDCLIDDRQPDCSIEHGYETLKWVSNVVEKAKMS